jgi:hypothetical protein
MNIVSSITLQCRDLVEASSIAVEDKRVIENKLGEIEKLLNADPFAAQRGIFIALPSFQKMLHHVQLLHDSPSANAFSDVVDGSDGIIDFLAGNKSQTKSPPPTSVT